MEWKEGCALALEGGKEKKRVVIVLYWLAHLGGLRLLVHAADVRQALFVARLLHLVRLLQLLHFPV